MIFLEGRTHQPGNMRGQCRSLVTWYLILPTLISELRPLILTPLCQQRGADLRTELRS
jgi:hypothetical protein